MSYLAIYRKYRPTTFDKLVGQDHIVKTLVSQIEHDKVGHAYLFCGTRGTGKTSTAKIFAKAINCEAPVNGSPCGKCATCKALSSPENVDIIEIDAASNNGVNEIRELKENVAFPPVNGKKKVYIIDEVHMLSASAFNALLKTLEEPPEHVVFILATTESHKLPQTILSRCMRFDFRLIKTEEIAKLISGILDDLGKSYEKEAVFKIAEAGEGSIRDALSIADICVSYSEGKLTLSDVLEVLGAVDEEKTVNLCEYVLSGDSENALKTVEDLTFLGKSIGLLTKETIETLRNILVVKTVNDAKSLLGVSGETLSRLKKAADNTAPEKILRAIETFIAMEGNLKYSSYPKILFETACVKASKPETDFDLTSLISRIQTLENKIKSGSFSAPEIVTRLVEKPAESKTEIIVEPKKNISSGEAMGLLIKNLRQNNELMLWAVVQSLQGEFDGETLKITAPSDGDYTVLTKEENVAAIKKACESLGSIKIEINHADKNFNDAEFESDVDKVKKIFGDDIVIIK